MAFDPTYRVQFSGKFLAGVSPATAIAAFAELAKIPLQQATTVLSGPRVLKKQLELAVAHAYRDKLQSIGLEVLLEPEAAQKPALTLSLEPIAERHAAATAPEPAAVPLQSAAGPAAGAPGMVVCPKCGHEQSNSSQCESCGVYFHKLVSRPEPEAVPQESATNPRLAPAEDTTVDHDSDEPQDPRPIAILAVCGVALASAYVWKLIAVLTEYEVGIVAWAIGGAIGFTAIALGSIGIRTGIICGALALCAILGGKYLVIDAFFDEITSEMQAEIQSALVAASAEEGGQEALAADAGLLQDMEGSEFFEQYAGVSVWDSVWESLSPIDYLFFFLGVATAFRMAATGRVK